MNLTIENNKTRAVYLFDDKSAVEAFIRKGWLEKVDNGKTPEESFCRYTPEGLEFKAVISRFQAN